MLDFAQRFAAADPATTPPDAPLSDEALALLDRVLTPRAAQPVTGLPTVRPRRPRWQLPRLGIAILVPALLVATLAAMGWGLFNGIGMPAPAATMPAEPSPVPYWDELTTEDELVASSDAILVADTIGSEYIEAGDEQYLVATVRVVSTGKGDFEPGQYLQVAFPMWPDDYSSENLDNSGNRVLLFLTTPGVAKTHADPVNPAQGSYDIVDEETLIPGPWNPVELSPDFLKRMHIRLP